MPRSEHDYEQYLTPSDGQVTVTGRLGRDPEKRTYEAKDGDEGVIANYSIARDKWDSREKKQVTIWTEVTTFGKSALRDLKNLAKGNLVQVVGELQVNARDDGKISFRMTPVSVNYLVWGGDKEDEEEEEKPARRSSRKRDEEEEEKPRKRDERKIKPEKSKVADSADESDELFN